MAASLTDLRTSVAALRAQHDAVTLDLGVAASDVDLRAAELRAAAASGDDATVSEAQGRLDDARRQRRTLLDRMTSIGDSILGSLAAFADDPCDAEADVPLVLLPVRLETRFVDSGATLRVRIFPDDVHLDRLDDGLGEDERSAAMRYWTAIWEGGAAAEGGAWQALRTSLHPNRAAWAAWSMTPTNLDQRPDPGASAPAPVFPEVRRRTAQPPVARLLPDRFVVSVSQGGSVVSVTGEPVPDRVVVSLPRDDDETTLVQAAGTVLGPGMEWFVDFDEAAKIGLAVSVTLPAPGQPVDAVTAYGVRASLDPAASATALASMVTGHRFGAGLALLAQGTPTNNTEQDRTDWSARPSPAPPPTTAAARTTDPTSDAGLLAAALGIDASVFAGASGSDIHEQELTRAAHTALWGPSWGTFLDRLGSVLPDAFDDNQREAMRDLFVDHVRGSGPLPALRLGNQPYGVLPVSSVDGAWVPLPTEPLGGPATDLLRRLRPLWRAGLAGAPRVHADQPLDDTLLEVLGSAPQLLGIRVRSLSSASAVSVLPALLGLGDLDTAIQGLLDLILWETLGLPGGTGPGGVLGKTTRPVGIPLADDSDPAFLAGSTTTVASVLQALVALARDQAQRAVDAAAPRELVPKVLDIALTSVGDLAEPLRRLSEDVLADKVEPVSLLAVVGRLSETVGPAGPVLHSRVQPVRALRNPLATTTLASPLTDVAMGVGLQLALQAWLRASAHQKQVEDAVTVLEGSSTKARTIATADVLDCSSHRFDAWTTALVSRRLADLRTATPTGCEVGAYGWVQDVVPQDPVARGGGYLLAPSVPHAVTAGVLRSAYLHHNPDSSGDSAFAVDLSSARVRAGRALLDGIRNGQPLGALLGYRFERLLHESPHAINRFVLSLRALAPLAGGKLTHHTEAPPQAASEAIAATDVVDGIKLIDAYRAGVDIRAALSIKPANPYLTDPWPPPTDEEWGEIVAAVGQLEGLADAVADLLMAEAVHQLVQGNTAGTAATLDAAAGGDALPVDPQVSRIPARGSAVTYRLLTLVGAPATGPADGWRRSPRSLAEPRLETWARGILGPATSIVCAVLPDGTRLTLDQVNLSALDVVCDAVAPDVLRSRLDARMPALAGRELAATRDAGWPAGLVAIGETAMLAASCGRALAGADPLLPASLTRAGDRPSRVVAAGDVTELVGRAQAAVDGLSATVAALAALPADTDQATLLRAVDAVAAYGVPTGPASTAPSPLPVLAEARRRVQAATSAVAAGTLPAAFNAVRTVFGEGFHVLPVVTAPAPDLFGARLGQSGVGPASLRRLAREVGAVRVATARFAETLLLGDALRRPRTLTGVQLAAAAAPGTDSWLGDGLSPAAPTPTSPVTCLVAETCGPVTGSGPLAGLVLDEWTEVLPARTTTANPTAPAPVQNLLTAGVAANVAAPDSRAPQAILLAISPDGQRWSSDRIRALLEETLELAQLRTVGLERVGLAGRLLPALQEESWSLQGEQTLDLTTLMTRLSLTERMIAFVKE
ncbi:MAG: hypothetical protein M3Z50_13610 [Actinomycetota bacterium]|nr:hypothetical protein [Actinomycetota bacterium]